MKANPPLTFFFGVIDFLIQSGQRSVDIDHRIRNSSAVYADTNSGRVRGTQHYSRGRIPFHFFRGIPYAKPPVGILRFEPPQPHPGWDGVLNATKYRPVCMQVNVFTPSQRPFGDENCLFLNVATRKSFLKENVSTDDLRSVIFWIHGGFFMEGSSNIYPPIYFMEHDIVFVTINYRLSSFGFLNTGDGTFLGNMGLKDQSLALKWVKENINFFNGDPERITIFGQDSGAVSAHMHTLSDFSQGLFSGVVSMGGTALSPWAINRKPAEQAVKMAHLLGCRHHNRTRMFSCLKRLPANKIAFYHVNVPNGVMEGKSVLFGPTIEHEAFQNKPGFLTDNPLSILERGNFSNKPWINGVNAGDGALVLLPIMRNDTLRHLINRRWHHYAPFFMLYRDHSHRLMHNISSQVRRYYLHSKPLGRPTLHEAIHMTSDRGYFMDSHRSALLHARIAPTYLYHYDYDGLVSLSELMFEKDNLPVAQASDQPIQAAHKTRVRSNILEVKSKRRYGACHGDELPLLFPWPLFRKTIDAGDVDYEMSKKFISLLVSFAETGVPNAAVEVDIVYWPPVKESNPRLVDKPLKRLAIDKTFEIIDEPFFRRMQFWNMYNIQ